jgi:chitin disaccharide deacetylase
MSEAALVLIVNADDYGLTSGTNQGIERAHAEGVVTSTSVMVNQIASEQAADLRRRHPELGIGIHLTLTLGEPVSDPGRVRSLVDPDGRLFERAELLARLRGGSLVAADVARECSAQLERLRLLAVKPDHWNVHQHVQEYAPIGAAVASAMAEAGLRVARNPRRLPIQPGLSPAGIAAALRARRRVAGQRAITALHRTPDALLDIHPAGWTAVAASLPAGVLEAICHPSEPEVELARLTPALTTRRVDELAALLAPTLRHALCARGARLSTFAAALGD